MQTCKLNTEEAPGNAMPSIPWKKNSLAEAQLIHHGVSVQENCTKQGNKDPAGGKIHFMVRAPLGLGHVLG